MKPKHPLTNKPIPTGKPSGNAHQRRLALRKKNGKKKQETEPAAS